MVVQSDPIDIPQCDNEPPQTHSNSNNSTPRHRQTASFSNSSGSLPSSLIPGSVNSIRPPILNELNLKGWSFKSVRSSISSASQIETY